MLIMQAHLEVGGLAGYRPNASALWIEETR
jgi:hypothetical protein